MAKLTEKKIVTTYNLELTKSELKLLYTLVGNCENSEITGIKETRTLFDAFSESNIEYNPSLISNITEFANLDKVKQYLRS